MTILVVFVSCSKLAEFLHVAFISVEKHHPVFFFAGLLFVFDILCMQTTLSFPSGIFWRSTDIRSLFEEYLRPPGRRFGIINPLTLVKSPAFLKETRSVFVPRSWFKSAVNLATEEQVSQAVESRNDSSSKTKHPSWTYG